MTLDDASADRKVIQCNYAEGTSSAPEGARAYVVLPNPGNGHDRIMVLFRSRGGRWVEKWESIKRLRDFRVKTLPPEHPMYSHSRQLFDYVQICPELERAARRAVGEETA